MDQLFEGVAEKCRKADFLENVMQKAHYESEDRELLWNVLEAILRCMEDGAAWSSKPSGDKGGKASVPCEVVMTLGAGVDALQEKYLSDGKLTEGYMVEILGSEILLLAYGAYNEWIRKHTDQVVARYYFLGMEMPEDETLQDAEVRLSIENLPVILARSGLPVTCTEGFCMVPKKSVAFYAALTDDRSVTCEGICMGCGREDCPNRMSTVERLRGNRGLDRPLTYGYARILGLFS